MIKFYLNFIWNYLLIFRHGTNKTTDGFETTIRSHCQEPIVEERNSLAALKIFITHACEVLELWKILCENHLNNIVNCLSKVIIYYLNICYIFLLKNVYKKILLIFLLFFYLIYRIKLINFLRLHFEI